jgi:hypothetical protein
MTILQYEMTLDGATGDLPAIRKKLTEGPRRPDQFQLTWPWRRRRRPTRRTLRSGRMRMRICRCWQRRRKSMRVCSQNRCACCYL